MMRLDRKTPLINEVEASLQGEIFRGTI